MGEICRIYNWDKDSLMVTVEPWGNNYELPRSTYLSVWIEEMVALIEVALGANDQISVYLNDCIFDDERTKIMPTRRVVS